MSYSGPLFSPSGQQTGQKGREKLRMGSFVAFYGSKRQKSRCVFGERLSKLHFAHNSKLFSLVISETL